MGGAHFVRTNAALRRVSALGCSLTSSALAFLVASSGALCQSSDTSPSQLVPRGVEVPSFDCSKAKTAPARLICADGELATLDGDLGRAFRKRKAEIPAADQSKLVSEQLAWLRERNTRCGLIEKSATLDALVTSKPCLINAMRQRFAFLTQTESPVAPARAPIVLAPPHRDLDAILYGQSTPSPTSNLPVPSVSVAAPSEDSALTVQGKGQDAPITACDTYAASPFDPARKAGGVALEEIDVSLAVPACEKAARLYTENSRLRYQLGRSYDANKEFGAALAQYRKAADHDYAAAQNNIGLMYEGGKGVPKDEAQALGWYQKAANQGYAAAQSNIGLMYLNGRGVGKDQAQALEWFRKAAEQDFVAAQEYIGEMYNFGDGVTQDYDEALRWYRKAADRGSANAQNNLGVMYMAGQGVAKDYVEAQKWYRMAAEQGNSVAQQNLGALYHDGQGVEQNNAEALRWFGKAAEQGDAKAMYSLGGLYYQGQGMPKNYNEAFKWFLKGAELGDANSEAILGGMFALGRGVNQNNAEAVKWLRKAADQGNAEAADNLASLRRQLPPWRTQEDNTDVGAGLTPADHSQLQAGLAATRTAQSNSTTPDRADSSQVASTSDRIDGDSSQIMPSAERLLIAAVEQGRATYAVAANDMARGAARPARAKEICAAVKNMNVANWVGKIQTLSSNSDGLGVLSVQIGDGISIKTWNNALSDTDYDTLIQPSSPVFKAAVALKEGQQVSFSGQFFSDTTDCVKESSLTLKGSLTQPDFIFRFSAIGPPAAVAIAASPAKRPVDDAQPRIAQVDKPIALSASDSLLHGADLEKIVSTYRENEMRFKRDFVGKQFSDILPFVRTTESMFSKGTYAVSFGSGRSGDVYCTVSSPSEVSIIADWDKGDKIHVDGTVKDVSFGSVDLEPCALSKQ